MRKASTLAPPGQLELFPGFDPRQRPLFPRSPWATGVDVHYPSGSYRERGARCIRVFHDPERACVRDDVVDRLETVNAGPMLEAFFAAERGE